MKAQKSTSLCKWGIRKLASQGPVSAGQHFRYKPMDPVYLSVSWGLCHLVEPQGWGSNAAFPAGCWSVCWREEGTTWELPACAKPPFLFNPALVSFLLTALPNIDLCLLWILVIPLWGGVKAGKRGECTFHTCCPAYHVTNYPKIWRFNIASHLSCHVSWFYRSGILTALSWETHLLLWHQLKSLGGFNWQLGELEGTRWFNSHVWHLGWDGWQACSAGMFTGTPRPTLGRLGLVACQLTSPGVSVSRGGKWKLQGF